MFDVDLAVKLVGDVYDGACHLDDTDRTGDLIVDDVIVGTVVGINDCKASEPFDCFFDSYKRFQPFMLTSIRYLAAFGGLDDKSVGHGPESVVEIEPSCKLRIGVGFSVSAAGVIFIST